MTGAPHRRRGAVTYLRHYFVVVVALVVVAFLVAVFFVDVVDVVVLASTAGLPTSWLAGVLPPWTPS